MSVAKALFVGPDLVKLHVTAAHAAILGADLAPRIAPIRAVTRRFSVRSCPSDLSEVFTFRAGLGKRGLAGRLPTG